VALDDGRTAQERSIDTRTAPQCVVELTLSDAERLREVAGELAQHFKVVEKAFGVRIDQRGERVSVTGEDASVALATRLITELYDLAGTGFHLHPTVVEHASRLVRQDPEAKVKAFFTDVVYVGRRKKAVFPRSVNQRHYIDAIRIHDVVFGVGPAGTGKTYLAVAMALSALMKDEVQRIVLCRPAVEAGEKLGFLPGDLIEKVNPYLRPLYDSLHDMVDFERVVRFIDRGVIEVAPLAFMRGRTLGESFVILDEAQNTTPEQMKMFLTRLGTGSKAVITGDPTQVDLPRGKRSGLADAVHVLSGVRGIATTRFTSDDVVRHGLVSDIIRAYDRAGRPPPRPGSPRRGEE
jgi:phosphate starvation-inducible protein PhoH and related proteins